MCEFWSKKCKMAPKVTTVDLALNTLGIVTQFEPILFMLHQGTLSEGEGSVGLTSLY
jgi:hypothetical protein